MVGLPACGELAGGIGEFTRRASGRWLLGWCARGCCVAGATADPRPTDRRAPGDRLDALLCGGSGSCTCQRTPTPSSRPAPQKGGWRDRIRRRQLLMDSVQNATGGALCADALFGVLGSTPPVSQMPVRAAYRGAGRLVGEENDEPPGAARGRRPRRITTRGGPAYTTVLEGVSGRSGRRSRSSRAPPDPRPRVKGQVSRAAKDGLEPPAHTPPARSRALPLRDRDVLDPRRCSAGSGTGALKGLRRGQSSA